MRVRTQNMRRRAEERRLRAEILLSYRKAGIKISATNGLDGKRGSYILPHTRPGYIWVSVDGVHVKASLEVKPCRK